MAELLIYDESRMQAFDSGTITTLRTRQVEDCCPESSLSTATAQLKFSKPHPVRAVAVMTVEGKV
jgi:hypothetical protein